MKEDAKGLQEWMKTLVRRIPEVEQEDAYYDLLKTQRDESVARQTDIHTQFQDGIDGLNDKIALDPRVDP